MLRHSPEDFVQRKSGFMRGLEVEAMAHGETCAGLIVSLLVQTWHSNVGVVIRNNGHYIDP